VLVADISAARQGLADSLGIRFRPEKTLTSTKRTQSRPEKHENTTTFSFSCDGPPFIELHQMRGDDAHAAHHGAGLHHLGYWVEDLNGFKEGIDGAGCFRWEGVVQAHDGTTVNWSSDPLSTCAVRMEYLETALQPRMADLIAGEPAPEFDRFGAWGDAAGEVFRVNLVVADIQQAVDTFGVALGVEFNAPQRIASRQRTYRYGAPRTVDFTAAVATEGAVKLVLIEPHGDDFMSVQSGLGIHSLALRVSDAPRLLSDLAAKHGIRTEATVFDERGEPIGGYVDRGSLHGLRLAFFDSARGNGPLPEALG
jgi:hypothetical protein